MMVAQAVEFPVGNDGVPGEDNNNSFGKEELDVQPCYHVSKERIKKYYPLDLNAMCQRVGIGLEDLITELIIGPDSTQSAAIFQDYLRDHGLNRLAGRVSLSDCPLRVSI